ncbi:MAG: polyprenyl diphosphate synthase [Candidatus Neomarinimicrobiota bacterium]|nr:polyprenyl diphosphate synthase [Candidatus Neomarinimicrobiota bacterium]
MNLINPNILPVHIGIIMDGNGRWAESQSMERISGHIQGVETVKTVVESCVKLKIPYLTLYTFSKENWNRPKKEVDGLMSLLSSSLKSELEKLNRNNIVLQIVGKIEEMPSSLQELIMDTVNSTKDNTGMTLALALSYSGRQEIIDATNKIISSNEKDINEDTFKNYLYSPKTPYPDLIIRTGGENRLSNFLLWQSAYSEISISEKNWPDFAEDDLISALNDFGSRTRKYGKVLREDEN